jgi:hypothetical protein
MAKFLLWIAFTALVAALIVLGYIFSIVWRVSLAEHDFFGRSDLIPLSFDRPSCTEAPTPESFGSGTYTYVQQGKRRRVYKQLINSFQHPYGSALASYELGSANADLLFRANEYFEAICLRNSGTLDFYLDTKKDLANNAIGREIGQRAVSKGLHGAEAEKYICNQVLNAIDKGVVLTHFYDSRVCHLPSLQAYGCPMLSQIQEFRSSDKSLIFN